MEIKEIGEIYINDIRDIGYRYRKTIVLTIIEMCEMD